MLVGRWVDVGWAVLGRIAKGGDELGAGCGTMCWVTSKQLVDRNDEFGRQGRPEPAEVGGVSLQTGKCGVGVGLTEERDAPGQALVEHEPERVEIGATVEFLASYLLGRQVLRRPHHDVVAGQVGLGRLQSLGDAEVGEQHPPVGRHHDVARLDVAMDEARFVSVVERCCDAGADVAGQFGAQSFLRVEYLAQALALDELHHDGLTTVLLEHVVDGDDVRMVEARRSNGFATEALRDDGIGGERRLEPLDGHLTIECEVDRQPHLGHAALREHALQFVPLRDDGGGGGRSRSGHDWRRTLALAGPPTPSIRTPGMSQVARCWFRPR